MRAHILAAICQLAPGLDAGLLLQSLSPSPEPYLLKRSAHTLGGVCQLVHIFGAGLLCRRHYELSIVMA